MKFNLKKNFLSYFKPILIASLILVVVASVFFGLFGFNKGFDFTGGTQLTVDIAQYNENEPQGMTQELINASEDISNIVKSKGIKINSFQVQGEWTDKTFLITFKDVKKSVLDNIRLEINKKYNKSEQFVTLKLNETEDLILTDAYSNFDITKNTCHIDGFISNTAVITTVSTLLFALVVCMVYALFRVKVSGALTIVLSGIMSVLLTMSFVVLTRIEINTYFFVALGLIELISVFMTIDTLFKIKAKLKDALYTDKNNEDIAKIVVEENFTKNIIVGIVAVVASLVVGLIGVLNILKLALVVFIGVVVSFVLNIVVMPTFWAKTNKQRNLVKPIITTTNDVDNNAEVVEINE